MEVFTENIEKVLLDHFDSAEKSILIVVAWFTNKRIVDRLIELSVGKKIKIQILTDDNDTNRKYFFELFQDDLENAGIEVKKQYFSKFNHNKFAVLDNEIIITGSYNYTYNANRNSENIVVKKDKSIAEYFTRSFHFFTDREYIDPNVEILMENFDFSNKLISMYYPFSKKLMSKLKPQIALGYCFTHENGLYNEISYEPGLIFNSRFKYHKELSDAVQGNKTDQRDALHSGFFQEFKLPVKKELIRDFKLNEINNFNYEIARESSDFEIRKIDFEALAELAGNNQKALEVYYTRKFKTTYSPEELRNLLGRGVDIIIEDYIWINNFAPFLNDAIVEKIYAVGKNSS